MNKYEITKKIEKFAPLETAEKWDCSGWAVETAKTEISKIMLCLTVTNDIIAQAKEEGCDMIISHHPLFYVPYEWSSIDIYSAHTNLDKAGGGTTDTIINVLGLAQYKVNIEHEFLRMVVLDDAISVVEFSQRLAKVSPNLRYVNNKNRKELRKIAFCAGSGSEFIADSGALGADCLVTGDLKFHTALDSGIVVYDIGHFESEIIVLPVFKDIIGTEIEVKYARESSPFKVLSK